MASIQSKRVRNIGRIRGDSNREADSLGKPQASSTLSSISINRRENGGVLVSFGDPITSGKRGYELDECYEQNIRNGEIFDKEVKGLVSGVFEGRTATVFGYGARRTGKTFTIQGSEYEPGLALLAVDEVLSQSQELGYSITISLFEVHQDHVFDLLDSKRPEVSVFEDGHGKIRLKGLSKVKVDSISEFQNLYLDVRKPLQKMAIEAPRLSHKGLIIHVLSTPKDSSDVQLVAKMNFLDLAGYEDGKRKSTDGAGLTETTKINKSLYALQNVVCSLNGNEAHVPYRETKLTRMLQDSLGGGRNQILMITCMNPSCSPDTIQTISLASRSCVANNRGIAASAKMAKSTVKAVKTPSAIKRTKPMSFSASAKKQTGSQLHISGKKPNGASMGKGRKLFNEGHEIKSLMQTNSISLGSSSTLTSQIEAKEKKSAPDQASEEVFSKTQSCGTEIAIEEKSVIVHTLEVESSEIVAAEERKFDIDSSPNAQHLEVEALEEENSFSNAGKHKTCTSPRDKHIGVDLVTLTPTATNFTQEGVDKENKNFSFNGAGSPPLSVKLREVSNNLKSLYYSSHSSLQKARENNASIGHGLAPPEISDPKTPKFQPPSTRISELAKDFESVHFTPQPSLKSTLDNGTSTDQGMTPHGFSQSKTPMAQLGFRDEPYGLGSAASPWGSLQVRSSGMKNSLANEFLKFINSASKEELMKIRGIGEKRATYILELRQESPEPFKSLDDLKDIGLAQKQIRGMIKNVAADLLT